LLTRDDAPALTDRGVWEVFPFTDFALVIVDSWGASTEGIDDGDGGRSGAALASLLEVARRGPAVVVALNVPKDGRNYRGSGVIADRLDVLYEVRDITDHQPASAATWWSGLAEAGEAGWSERATRRRRRNDYRLALIPSKFRIGEEPDPIALEIDLGGDAWALRDVTVDLKQARERARQDAAEAAQAAERAACESLRERIEADGSIRLRDDAIAHLAAQGVARDRARELIQAEEGGMWRTTGSARRGDPRVLVRVPPESVAGIAATGSPSETGIAEMPIPADRP
jgi:hypothetical protein